MKKLSFIMAFAAFALGSCTTEPQPQPLNIDNQLSAEEISAAKFTPDVMWKMGRLASATLSPDGSKALYAITRYNMAENRGLSQIYVRDMATGNEVALTDNSSNNNDPQWSADGSKIYFTSNRSGSMQLWQMATDGSSAKQITDIEGGIEGYGVAPSGDKLFYVKKVHAADTKSSDIHKDMDKSKARIYDDLMARHWDYWDEGDYSHIFVADLTADGVKNDKDIIGEKSAWDAPLAPYFDTAEIAWSNDGKKLAYTCKPLTGTEYAVSTDSDIFIYNTEDGSTLNINKIKTNAGMRIMEFVGYDRYPVWSPDDKQLAFCSMATPGYESDKDRLFVYDLASKEHTYLTPDFDHSASNVIWKDAKTLYFLSAIEGTQQVCKVATDNAKVDVITSGDHDIASMSIAGDKCLTTLMTISRDKELYDVNLADGKLTQLSKINAHVYDNVKMGKVEKRMVKTTDGKEMLTWVILPPDFDPAKKYPTLLYCEGGPQSVVSQGWSYRWNFQLMASQGYVVVAPNRRGCPSFGSEWREQISGDYSGQNIKDYLAAIDEVAKEPWCDKEHLGCVGASYGGYSVYYLAGNHDGRFKAFISHCGIFNFESMYGETEELFFINHDYGGNYWDKSNAIAQRSYANSPHKFVQKWDTPILIITGEFDFRIPFTQSMQAFTAARLMGVDARLVEFENEAHQVFKPQNSIVWNREFFGWLDKYLKK
ncbi:MAG: S9 family peptidase, partial [Alistipes sp.]|nr:S9 family peptidase [Alistipes sp.]MBR2400060.1 S9 family peptidase [Alistipes sp.]